ncbi:MAG: M55 family metallopeptidase [Candidatus Bathyarchaeia archaeon]|nr:M55 family metallopeptidase [Candidatus Bathyarchaeota archaeon]
MKIYILTDLEGASCVVREEQTVFGSKEYEEACLLLTRDVNAAIEGAIDGGAEEIVVNDLHGARRGFNLALGELHEGAKYIIGGPRHRRITVLDESFDLAFMMGYHAMAGTQGAILDHTMSSRAVVNVYINDLRVGEIGIDASILGCFNVPVALITGCRKAVEEARSLLGNIEGVSVKEGFGRNFALCLPPARSRILIREAAKRAVERAKMGDFKPFKVNSPITVKVEYSHPNYADALSNVPSVERADARTIIIRSSDLLDAMRRLAWY